MSSPRRDPAVFVVALAPQSGKSTVARHLAERLGVAWAASSWAVARSLETRLELVPGQIAAERADDHERWRPELIEEGDRMRAEGSHPGAVCVREGYRVVDGIRSVAELQAARLEALRLGLQPLVLCIERPGAVVSDNTDAAGLREEADAVIVNDGSISELLSRADAALG